MGFVVVDPLLIKYTGDHSSSIHRIVRTWSIISITGMLSVIIYLGVQLYAGRELSYSISIHRIVGIWSDIFNNEC